jgi:hypothetical protein
MRQTDPLLRPVEIAGRRFNCFGGAFAAARDDGYNGGRGTLYGRYLRGVKTWPEFVRPVQSKSRRQGLDDVVAGLDARKRAIEEVSRDRSADDLEA